MLTSIKVMLLLRVLTVDIVAVFHKYIFYILILSGNNFLDSILTVFIVLNVNSCRIVLTLKSGKLAKCKKYTGMLFLLAAGHT